MASYKGPVAPETPPLSMPSALDATESSNLAKEAAVALDVNRSKSLKRTHATALGSPGPAIDPYLNPIASPPKSARLDVPSRQGGSPVHVHVHDVQEEALGLVDERRKDDDDLRQMPPGVNDATGYRVLTELNADNMATASTAAAAAAAAAVAAVNVARADEGAITTTSTSQPMEVVAVEDDEDEETSPRSATSNVSMAGVPVATESPAPMDMGRIGAAAASQAGSLSDDKSAASLSYPGPLQAMGSLPPTPTRGMTYPEGATPSSANKKYKCPYCENEFTRHHNLKSHLLTHSQEKPYCCDMCPMKFRRLHDLKRHGKLHTGEKPHVCPKCDRKFARGDALVRHTKGVMGCSMARSSAGGAADGAADADDTEPHDGPDGPDGPAMVDADESAMSGVVFANEDMTEEDRRRLSLASGKTTDGGGPSPDTNTSNNNTTTTSNASHARTYPPARGEPNAAAAAAGSLFSSSSFSSSSNNNTAKPGSAPVLVPVNAANANSAIFAHNPGMTESPKPITPSPRVQPGGQYNRRQSERPAPPPPPPPSSSSSHTSQTTKLPGMSVFASGDPRFAPSPAVQVPTSSIANGSQTIDAANMFSGQAIWNQMQSLEAQVQKMHDKMVSMEQTHQLQISLLNSEISTLKKHISTQDGAVQT